ncbi:dynamin family protein [Dactylosporangium sp. CS-047395]|uniref:dynamin family protein n=1 Tax=Dactylosporangium sp. CS-047395 TaxID=3239936 RepID=UPI003D909E3D
MAEYDVLRQEILAQFERVTPLAHGRGAEVTVDRLFGAQERLHGGRLTVVVCGEFNRGKSSLLNALLNQPNLLATDAFFATRLVTTIGRGDREEVWVSLDEDAPRPAERRRIRRDQIGEFTAQGTTNPDAERARLVEITLPDERIAAGMLLVDTPGVGGVFYEHTRVTKHYLPAADAIVFVASAEEPLSKYEVDFLTEAAHAVRGSDNPDALLVALTKADLVTDIDVWIEGVRRRVADATGRDGAAVRVFPVSSLAKQEGLAIDDAELIEQSGFPRLEAALWAQLARHRAKVILGGALAEIDAALRVLLQPLQSEAAALQDSSRDRLAELERETERESARLAELAAGAAPWRLRLDKSVEALRRTLAERAAGEFDRVWTRAEQEYVNEREYQEQPDRLGARLNGDLDMAMTAVGEWGGKQAAQLQRDLAAEIGLELGNSALGALPPPGLVDLGGLGRLQRPTRTEERYEPAEYRTVRETVTLERNAVSRGLRSVTGFLFGKKGQERYDAFIPPKVKVVEREELVRAERRWTVEVTEEIPAHVLAERREQLRAAVADGRRNQTRTIEAAVERVVGDYTKDIAAELDSRINREQERITDTLPRLKAAAAATAEQARARLAELAVEQAPLLELRDGSAALIERVTHLSSIGEDGQ